jgi:hypothetical protein
MEWAAGTVALARIDIVLPDGKLELEVEQEPLVERSARR